MEITKDAFLKLILYLRRETIGDPLERRGEFMKKFKIPGLLFLFVIACISASAQMTAADKPCNQNTAERAQLIKEANENPYRVRRIEFFGNTFIKDRVFRGQTAFAEGDIFTKELLVKSIKNLNKSKAIYSMSLKNIRIRLDKSNKDVDLVFCLKER